VDELLDELKRRGLVVVPRDHIEEMRGRGGGGGGAIFTGIAPGVYNIGGGQITVNGRGQVIRIRDGGGGGDVRDLLNIGGAAEVYFPPLVGAGIARLRTLASPTGSVSIVQTADQIQFESTGESNTGANLPAGEGIFAQKNGSVLEFKSLVGAGSVSLSSTADEITIDSSGEANTCLNLPGGIGLFAQKTGTVLDFKSLTSVGGTVAITQTPDNVNLEAVAATPSTGTFPDSGPPLDISLGQVTDVSQVIARASIRGLAGAIAGEVSTYRIVVSSDGASISPFSDILQVDGPSPLSTLVVSVVQNGNSIDLRITRSGAGDNFLLYLATEDLPLV